MPIKPLGGFGLTTGGGGGAGSKWTTVIDQDLNGIQEIYIDTEAHPNCRFILTVDQTVNGSFQVQAVASSNGISFLSNSVDITRTVENPSLSTTEETETGVTFGAFRAITGRAHFRGHGFISGSGSPPGSWMQGECQVGTLSSSVMTGATFAVEVQRQFIGFRFSSAVDVGRLLVEELA